ncbi:hypothetical protein D7X33_06950 [Butyricicoccus sp. 1XD8-22]|nr:hypothetical protein D7X33_06950 [Butyricicoccus sp. 1XD8-22]
MTLLLRALAGRAACAAGGRALPCTPLLAGGAACAAGGGALPLHPAPRRRGSLRGWRQGAAPHPLGLSPQTPRC